MNLLFSSNISGNTSQLIRPAASVAWIPVQVERLSYPLVTTAVNPLQKRPISPLSNDRLEQKDNEERMSGRFSPDNAEEVPDDSYIKLFVENIFSCLWASNISDGLFGMSYKRWKFPITLFSPQHPFCQELIRLGFAHGMFDAQGCSEGYLLNNLERKIVERMRTWVGPVQPKPDSQKNLESRSHTRCQQFKSAFFKDLAELIAKYPGESSILRSFLPDSSREKITGELAPVQHNPLQFF